MQTQPLPQNQVFIALSLTEATTLDALFEQLFPADENGPGASSIGVIDYLDRALSGPYADQLEAYRLAVYALNAESESRFGKRFADANPAQQQELIAALEQGSAPSFRAVAAKTFFELARTHLQEGLFADPIYGGNRDKAGWRFLGHPGVWLENSAEENLCDKPVDKGGEIRSLANLNFSRRERRLIAGYDPHRGTADPAPEADVLLVGAGTVGSLVAPVFAKAGLKAVALELGPFRTQSDYLPDELGSAYYCRANMGAKFLSEVPQWRRNNGEPTQEATFSLGRMMNSVGGSIIHYGGWMRRFHPHRLADWMEGKSEEILREMGATKTWRGDRFTGVGSSHDFGGARMGEDPGRTVVSPELLVHDTPGLYVFSGAAFPTCPGINPTLTLTALVYRAAERLVQRMSAGEER